MPRHDSYSTNGLFLPLAGMSEAMAKQLMPAGTWSVCKRPVTLMMLQAAMDRKLVRHAGG